MDHLIDTLLVAVACVCAPAMVYNIWAGNQRAKGIDTPDIGDIARALAAYAADAWAYVGPVVETVAYLLKRLIAHQWQPTEADKPAWMRRAAAPDYDNSGPDEDDDPAIVAGVADSATISLQPIAITQNGNNDAIVIAALAPLVAAGKLTQTDAIKGGLGIAPSSTSVRYQEARNLLRLEVDRIRGAGQPQHRLTPEQIAWRKQMGLEDGR